MNRKREDRSVTFCADDEQYEPGFKSLGSLVIRKAVEDYKFWEHHGVFANGHFREDAWNKYCKGCVKTNSGKPNLGLMFKSKSEVLKVLPFLWRDVDIYVEALDLCISGPMIRHKLRFKTLNELNSTKHHPLPNFSPIQETNEEQCHTGGSDNLLPLPALA